jgi:hypothetical protein
MNPLETPSRQTKFLEIYKNTKDKDFAAQEAWPELPPNRRKRAASHVLTEPRVRQYLQDAGLGINKVFKTIAKGLDAKRTLNLNGIVEEVDNTEAQLKAAEMACKLHGLLRNKDTVEAQEVKVTIDPGRLAEVAARLEVINAKMLPDRGKVVDADVIN